MKNIYLLFVVLVLPSLGFAQTGSFTTVRQIYNYAVGDSFEYHIGSSDGGDTYYWNIILNRNNYGNDSIVYTEKSISGGNGSSISGTITTNISNLDSAFYAAWLYSGNTVVYYLDSTNAVNSIDDTVYKAWMHINYSFYCASYGDGIGGIINAVGQCKLGLGATDLSYCFTAIACNSCTDHSLLYYHKANGGQPGTPFDFTTGIRELSGNSIQLFPNPATDNFQLQFTELPADKTSLQIFNGLGQAVMGKGISSSSTSINRGKLSNGIYFWQVLEGEQILQRGKLILQ